MQKHKGRTMRDYFRNLTGDDNIGLINVWGWGNAQYLWILVSGWQGYMEGVNEFGVIGLVLTLIFWTAQIYNIIAILYLPVFLLTKK